MELTPAKRRVYQARWINKSKVRKSMFYSMTSQAVQLLPTRTERFSEWHRKQSETKVNILRQETKKILRQIDAIRVHLAKGEFHDAGQLIDIVFDSLTDGDPTLLGEAIELIQMETK